MEPEKSAQKRTATLFKNRQEVSRKAPRVGFVCARVAETARLLGDANQAIAAYD